MKNEILDHSISKGWCVTPKMSQSVRTYGLELFTLHVVWILVQWENVWWKICSESWHWGKAFFNICDYFKTICQNHRDSISHIERTVNVLCEDPTKITITNASNDKQITLKRDYIYKIENTDLEIGVSGVLLRILFYFEAHRCSRQTGSVYELRINLLNIMIQRTLLRGRGTSITMKLNESIKGKNTKQEAWTYVDSNSRPFGCKLCTITTWLVNKTVQNVSLNA